MELEHSFTVDAAVDDVWQALLDPERVAPCMPGATLTGVDGSTFTGKVKVKLGPVSMQYKGTGKYAQTDESARTVVIEASGKDAKGNGTASATVTLRLTGDGQSTEGTSSTDLTVTGKPAQFGRGMISDVGGKILEQFAVNLSQALSRGGAEQAGTGADGDAADARGPEDGGARATGGGPGSTGAAAGAGAPAGAGAAGAAAAGAGAAAAAAGSPGSSAADTGAASTGAGTAASTPTNGAGSPSGAAASGPRAVPPQETEALDLSQYARGAVLKRALPLMAAGAVAAFIAILILRGRRGTRD